MVGIPVPEREARVLGVRSSGALVWCCDRCGRPAVGYFVLYQPVYTKQGAIVSYACTVHFWRRFLESVRKRYSWVWLHPNNLRVTFVSDKRDYVNF
ncbi:MAG: hypothetical protein E6K59_03975 [Nitrospirae bacterium]|nr:MAG: hypothetical protein E6K59_03975 [Nitrospirota bacterium]